MFWQVGGTDTVAVVDQFDLSAGMVTLTAAYSYCGTAVLSSLLRSQVLGTVKLSSTNVSALHSGLPPAREMCPPPDLVKLVWYELYDVGLKQLLPPDELAEANKATPPSITTKPIKLSTAPK